ncbi:DUF3106 domain-containing protein [Pseudoxanthomonas sacheonensis]|uniref:Fe-S protein YdhL (DUF1289 family) n=1 Tax=Pseudoxanthomonas sacheonensis TaxID=443615 RepID=A0ABU1RW09_9GAMM|nr:DUF3106 domain-containing protein [Pseudoxanthomonas sacheonensis]MDR6842962.1 putative Fe-S protein YdhL (DUF1289 family) [Pseudoxanthomonas sacheonensis]
MKTALSRSLALGLLLLAGNALAQSTPAQSLPEWEKLTPQQRDALIAPVRERWNSDPDDRPRMLEHAQRWKSMTPEQRRQARKGMRRFEGMNPHQREEARVLFLRMKDLPPEQRKKLRDDWKAMTPEQRRAWIQKNAPQDSRQAPPPLPPLPPR